ncbi:hypothetical protein UlMin_021321 [Ulmus minor]
MGLDLPSVLPVFALLLFLYILLRKPKSSRKQPPKAGGGWPIIGHLLLLGGSQPPHITLGKMADKYGPIFTIQIGVHKTLIVSGWEMAKECFTTNDKAFANRPKSVAIEIMGYNYAMFGFGPYGSYWRHLRKIATLELLTHNRLSMSSHIRESEVKGAIKEVYEMWVKDKKVMVEMKKWFGDIALNVSFRIIFGKRFLGTSSNEESEENDRCRRALRDFFALAGTFVASDAIPWLGWLDMGGYEKLMRKTGKDLDELAENWLEEHKRKRGCGQLPKADQDFMDVMISILDAAEDISSNFDADTINKATCLTFILGATDTTMVTMTWGLALLLNNRDTLKKVQEELDEHVGRQRQVKESDLKNLVYLQAIIKETLRLYPALPLLAPHEAIEDCNVDGYDVVAGTRLLVNVSKLHRDQRVWSDPDEFKPERFLTDHKDIDLRGHNFEFIPFGSGRRICPGISFALQAMQLTLANLLQGFDLTTPFDEPVDMLETIGLTNLKAMPLDVLLNPRLPSKAYE